MAGNSVALDALPQENDELRAKNHALASALTRAGKELQKAKAQLGQMASPPLNFATMLSVDSAVIDEQGVQHARAEVVLGSRRLIVPVASNVPASHLKSGQTVLLNENMVLVAQRGIELSGAVRVVKQSLDDGRLIVADESGSLTLVERSGALAKNVIEPASRILVDGTASLALEILPSEDDADLVLEQKPDVTFADIGGLDTQIERIKDAVELPFLHRELFQRYDLRPPKGMLLYGPPGNGKTLIAKAVANALSRDGTDNGVFISVKGPELLSKYVGESERLIRLIFKRARARATDGRPVIVFIDEMDSLLRTRGSGISSDVETTIVPQFLTELDGIERLDNVIVIGASNRIDMIDPAVLRPGRLDTKIRVDRPNRDQAVQIVSHYLTDGLLYEAGQSAATLTATLVESVYDNESERHICNVCDDQGRWSRVTFADVMSGAMLKNIVDRIKTNAVKDSITLGRPMEISIAAVRQAVDDEFIETSNSMLDSDPAEWSKINGIAGGRVVRIRPAE
ncbi:proteasome-associated ATPase [Bifidobacterium commune]|uniref:Proteasome-associated ATPase n=1 Tax=Bifidobacterium commune TaxID=1505727 RepID=A0A1C4H0R8_9BIFI|nr:proteasome ATPase [Bifidobacterium commune]MBB2954672.1 proteasome-associated ATPase [Bifidobacterium commune]SCC78523.1 proteasome-associated ATPase [Bifidobacterium commune]